MSEVLVLLAVLVSAVTLVKASTLRERTRIRSLLLAKSAEETEFAKEKCVKDSPAQRMHEAIAFEFRIFVKKKLT